MLLCFGSVRLFRFIRLVCFTSSLRCALVEDCACLASGHFFCTQICLSLESRWPFRLVNLLIAPLASVPA